jgi:Neprosin
MQPFAAFVDELKAAQADNFVARPSVAQPAVVQPSRSVSDASEFEKMRKHLLARYAGVTVRHSYALDEQVFDCVPILQQPSLRAAGVTQVASPPPFSPGPPRVSVLTLPPGSHDQFGNLQSCQDGEIPMRRVTLDEMTRFRTLHEFLQKEPSAAAPSHKYAYEYQDVANYGGYSILSLWKPGVNTLVGEIFSLAQHWYEGTSPSAPVQTAEVGWQVYPQKYNTKKPVLFVYWTADGYNSTGCYNLDCPGFVQTDKHLHLGAAFHQYSIDGSPSVEIDVGYYYYNGNWWLGYGGTNTWVGYIPATVYNGGQLSKFANEIVFGGETVGATKWPKMGSGQFAQSGATEAAYQRSIMYRDSTGATYNASLTAVDPSPKCYTTDSSGAPMWGVYFFFGGPGGKSC